MAKKIAVIVVALAIVIAGVVFIPKVVNKCDNCGETIIGTGFYKINENDYASIISDIIDDGVLSLTSADLNSVVCEDCINAISETVENYSFGVIDINIEDLKRPLFE